jgi:hypothetical protein
MSAPPPTSISTGVIFLVIIVLVMARRTYALSQGTPYSAGRVFGYGAFSTALFALLAASTIYVAVGTWGMVGLALIAPYALVVLLTAWVAEPRVRRHVRFEERPDGQLFYRLPFVIPLLTLVLFAVRVTVEVLLFGVNAFFSFTFPTTLPLQSLLVLIAVDLVYGGSIGLLYGRAFAVRAAFRERPQNPPLPS